MKFMVSKASDWDYKSDVEIKSLEDLIKFLTENGASVIKLAVQSHEKVNELIIYDDYLE